MSESTAALHEQVVTLREQLSDIFPLKNNHDRISAEPITLIDELSEIENLVGHFPT